MTSLVVRVGERVNKAFAMKCRSVCFGTVFAGVSNAAKKGHFEQRKCSR